jgi:hypothetical protein
MRSFVAPTLGRPSQRSGFVDCGNSPESLWGADPEKPLAHLVTTRAALEYELIFLRQLEPRWNP